MADHPKPHFVDNRIVKGNEGRYVELSVRPAKVLESWRMSLFSFEWLRPDGKIKPTEDLPEAEQERKKAVENALKTGQALEKPVLGIGMLDNVEIGAGRAVFLTLADQGVPSVPVHIPQSHMKAFKPFLANDKEAGNVLYYLLVAVVLLSALSIAVATGWQSSVKSLSEDKQRLLATEILSYSDNVAKSVSQLRLRGITMSQLRFSSPDLPAGYGTYGTTPEAELFNPDGGGLHYRPPPEEAMTTPGNFVFTAANAIYEIGTTCTSASCTDLIMIAGPLKTEICTMLNSMVDVSNISGSPPSNATGDVTTLFAGTPSYTATIGAASGPAYNLTGKTAGCFNKSGDNYFYQVLVPQ